MSTARALRGASTGDGDAVKTGDGENDNAENTGDFFDEIAVNRALPVTPSQKIPQVPAGYRPTLATDRIKRLGRISDAQMPLAREAAVQVLARAEHWKDDLGDLAPDLRPLASVVETVEECEKTVTALQLLLSYHMERYDIARGDLNTMLRATQGEVKHRAPRKPHLARAYSKLTELFDAMSAAIADGIAQSKQNKKTDKG